MPEFRLVAGLGQDRFRGARRGPVGKATRKGETMDNWDDLRVLVAVSKTGTMTGAARLLGTNLAMVSRRVDRLTQQLGVAPFVKTADGWKPSPAVAGLIEVAKAFEDRLTREIDQSITPEIKARVPVRIGCPSSVSSYVLFPALVETAGRLAGVQLEFTDRVLEDGLGDNDVMIRMGQPEGGRLRSRRVGEMPVRLYAVAGAETGGDWVGMDKIFDQTGPVQLGNTYFNRMPLVRVPSFRSLMDLIVQSRLPGPLPDVMAATNPALRCIAPDQCFVIDYWVVYPENRANDPAIEATVDWIDAAFAAVDAP